MMLSLTSISILEVAPLEPLLVFSPKSDCWSSEGDGLFGFLFGLLLFGLRLFIVGLGKPPPGAVDEDVGMPKELELLTSEREGWTPPTCPPETGELSEEGEARKVSKTGIVPSPM